MRFRTMTQGGTIGRRCVLFAGILGIGVGGLETTPSLGANPRAAIEVRLLDSRAEHVVIRYSVEDVTIESVVIGGQKHAQVSLGTESRMKVVEEGPSQ